MTSLNPFADDEPPLPNSARYEPGIWKRESRSDGNPGGGRISCSLRFQFMKPKLAIYLAAGLTLCAAATSVLNGIIGKI